MAIATQPRTPKAPVKRKARPSPHRFIRVKLRPFQGNPGVVCIQVGTEAHTTWSSPCHPTSAPRSGSSRKATARPTTCASTARSQRASAPASPGGAAASTGTDWPPSSSGTLSTHSPAGDAQPRPFQGASKQWQSLRDKS